MGEWRGKECRLLLLKERQVSDVLSPANSQENGLATYVTALFFGITLVYHMVHHLISSPPDHPFPTCCRTT